MHEYNLSPLVNLRYTLSIQYEQVVKLKIVHPGGILQKYILELYCIL